MAATPEQLIRMEAAYFSGEKTVSFNGRTVIYHDLPQLWEAIQNARRDTALAGGVPVGGPRHFVFKTARGF